MIKFSKMSWCMIICFTLAFICIMFNTLLNAMIYPALVLLIAGCTLLSIRLFSKASLEAKRSQMIQEELLMELSVTDEGEQYVLNSRNQKKLKKQLRRERFSKLLPALMSTLMALILLFLLIKFIFKFWYIKLQIMSIILATKGWLNKKLCYNNKAKFQK